jgi:hypothetical protein
LSQNLEIVNTGSESILKIFSMYEAIIDKTAEGLLISGDLLIAPTG